MTGEDDEAPLAGVHVVELSMYVQGPVAGLALASLGADVVKIEQVGRQDYMRDFRTLFGVTFDDRGREWMYASLNRNKRSLALDVASEAGRPVFHRMIERADVFVTNLRDGGLARLGADAGSLLAVNPRLVYCRGAGFGMRGPLADDPCQDTVGMAFAGFMDATAPTDVPHYPPGSMSDILTGTNMAAAVLAGLVKRERTGRGCVVGTSQTQALLWLELQAAGVAANLGEQLERYRHDTTSNPLFTVYETADGWIAVAALQSAQWPAIVCAVGLDHLLDDPRFQSFAAVLVHRDEFRPVFAAHLRTMPTRHWWQALRAAGVWVSPVNRLGDLADRRAHPRQRVPRHLRRRLRRPALTVRRRRLEGRPRARRRLRGAQRRGARRARLRRGRRARAQDAGSGVVTAAEVTGTTSAGDDPADAPVTGATAAPDGAVASGPLSGVRVIDFSAVVSGPFATSILADQGADVIVVEPVHMPDIIRRSGPLAQTVGAVSAMYASQNRNKRSIAVDLKDERGRRLVEQLVAGADVVMQNFRPGVLDRLGLGWEDLRRVNPDLVMCSISGFGADGPYSHRPALDSIVQAVSGYAMVQADADGVPHLVSTIVCDKVTSLNAAQACAPRSWPGRTATGVSTSSSPWSTPPSTSSGPRPCGT